MSTERFDESFFEPGRNCMSVRHAQRFSLLFDGEDYFRVLREALTRAERTVFILGWDIDSRMTLTPEGSGDGLPEALGDFLHAIAAHKKRLRIYILAWDFAMLYAFEREWLPVYKMGWRTHRRMAFQMDGKHPMGGSQHQKIVVIDDRLACVGGLDLTRSRWDTTKHAADDPLRRYANGTPYQPFHDVHTMFDGDAAREIGMLARDRWARTCGRRLAIRSHRVALSQDAWPPSRDVDLDDVRIAISLTEPAYLGRALVQQIRAQYLDAIARAAASISRNSTSLRDRSARRCRNRSRARTARISPSWCRAIRAAGFRKSRWACCARGSAHAPESGGSAWLLPADVPGDSRSRQGHRQRVQQADDCR